MNTPASRFVWDGPKPPKQFHGALWNTLAEPLQKQIKPFLVGDAPLLTFVGPPGTGKSWASWATVGLFLLRHETFRYADWYELDQWAKDSRLFGEDGGVARGNLNGLKGTELLVIDEFATAKPYEAEFMTVMSVIHHRFNRCLKTILITTRSDAELTASVGEAMVSRIGSGIVVKMTGRDKRAK